MIDICENTYCLKLLVLRAKEWWWTIIQGKVSLELATLTEEKSLRLA